jgi:hypothetical protein
MHCIFPPRLILAACLVALLSACDSLEIPKDPGLVQIVDRHGTPLKNGVLIPDYEVPQGMPHVYDSYELQERASDANGLFHVSLDECLWNSDGCYHFHINRTGYDPFTMTVSKDLFPPVLRITMVEKTSDTPPAR